MQDFEILVVGDGCTDDSEDVVAAIGDPRIRWINLPANTRHQSAPNNEGLRQARGEFVAYLGHDDLWLPHHLELHVAALDSSAAITYSLLIVVNPGASEPRPVRPRPDHGGWSPPSCTVHRRSIIDAIGGWRDYRELRVSPETDLWRRARAAGFELRLVPRLTAIKFPASARHGVYLTRPSNEQASWSARIASERDLEAALLAEIVASSNPLSWLGDRELLKQLMPALFVRIGRRLRSPSKFFASRWPRKGAIIDSIRRFKGL
jgi:glycosyltransferase involved in cell wall biosynthesis